MFEFETIANGVRLLTAPREDSPSATALVMFGVGSRFEQAHQSGIAHFAEHMFFKGTERRPTARDISVEIDGIGGDFNAFTGKEYTGYYVKCASEHLDLAVDVLADMLLHSKFDADEIEREKGVILEEMAMYRDLPQRYVGNVYDELLFGDTPLGWDIIGTEDVIKGADRDLFKSFTDRWYTANRTVVGLAGNVSESAKAAAAEKFLALPGANEGTRLDAEWSQDGPQVKLHHKDSEQAHLLLGVRAPGLMDDDRYALGVLNAILGGGMSSRLFTEVRERRGLCYYVYSHHDAYTDAGSLVVAAGVDVKRIDEAITTILDELWKLVEDGPDEAEFNKAKNYLKGKFVLGVEDTRGLIMFGARREAVEDGYWEPAQALAAIDAITMDDVKRIAARIFDREQLNLAVVGPFDDEERFAKLLAPTTASV
ncbi:MAG: insulinase family protein [Thermoleophilia bacterium]|nr:insulinase family protein [Thermoleophilia bacterium]